MAKITDSLKSLAEKALGVILPTPRYSREHPEEGTAPKPVDEAIKYKIIVAKPDLVFESPQPADVPPPANETKKQKAVRVAKETARKVFVSGGRNGLIIRVAAVLMLLFVSTCADQCMVADRLTNPIKTGKVNEIPEEYKGVRGAATVSTVINLVETEFDRPLGGYRRDNVLWFGALSPFDNVQSFQLGVLEVIQRVMFFLKERVSKEGGSSDPFNTNLKDAAEWLNAPGFIPVATNLMYNHFAVSNLETYLEDIKAKKATFVGQSEALYHAFQMLNDMLGDAHNELTTDKVTFTTSDDYYYHALGVAYASMALMRAFAIDFADEIKTKNIGSHVARFDEEMMKAMERKIPWMVWNNSQINDRSMLETPINEARNKLPSALASIEK